MLSGGGYLSIDNKHLRVEEHPDGAIRGWGRMMATRWRISWRLLRGCRVKRLRGYVLMHFQRFWGRRGFSV